MVRRDPRRNFRRKKDLLPFLQTPWRGSKAMAGSNYFGASRNEPPRTSVEDIAAFAAFRNRFKGIIDP
jgi:hypothetical protein